MEIGAQEALGIVETRGTVTAAEALDAMSKATNVRFMGQRNTGAGLVAVIIAGDLAAVRVATDAAVERARRVGEVVAVTVMPRPSSDVLAMLDGV